MQYQSPDPADFANVHALNREFLRCLKLTGTSFEQRMDVGTRLLKLSSDECEYLSRSSFLLFSIDDGNTRMWSRLFNSELDMLDSVNARSPWLNLLSTSISYLWHLSARNPFAARLVSGATIEWCEQLAGSRLMLTTTKLLASGITPTPRSTLNGSAWDRLLTAGVSNERALRNTARVCGLQSLLLQPDALPATPVPAAACQIHQSARSVAMSRSR